MRSIVRRLLSVHQCLAQRRTVAIVRQLGGFVVYERGNELDGPAILVRLFGRDFVDNIECVDLAGTAVTNRDLECLRPLKGLRWLRLSYTAIDDGCVSILGRLTDLAWICLTDTRVSAGAIDELQTTLPGCDVIRNA